LFFEFAAISCTWVILKHSYALCFVFLHLKQSFFFNDSFLLRSRFDILNFFHTKIDDMNWADDVLMTEQAAEIADALTINWTFNSVNLTLTFMQMLINSFKFMIHSLSITHWKSELILCWRSFNKVSLLYFSSALNPWNFIQNSWKKILF